MAVAQHLVAGTICLILLPGTLIWATCLLPLFGLNHGDVVVQGSK